MIVPHGYSPLVHCISPASFHFFPRSDSLGRSFCSKFRWRMTIPGYLVLAPLTGTGQELLRVYEYAPLYTVSTIIITLPTCWLGVVPRSTLLFNLINIQSKSMFKDIITLNHYEVLDLNSQSNPHVQTTHVIPIQTRSLGKLPTSITSPALRAIIEDHRRVIRGAQDPLLPSLFPQWTPAGTTTDKRSTGKEGPSCWFVLLFNFSPASLFLQCNPY